MHTTAYFKQPARLKQAVTPKKDQGSAIVIAIIGAALLITSGIILASNSLWMIKSAVKSSDFRNSREVSEYGAAAVTEELNTDGKSYLLVVQPACWQSTTLDVAGIYMPPGTAPGPNKISGVKSNTTGEDWKVIALKPGQTTIQATTSGTYARYQLIKYLPPQRPGQNANYDFSDSCPASIASRFGNRYGGSAFLTIRGELWRKVRLESQHTISQEIHVKGLMASSFGETSLVLTRGGELDTIKPYADLNNNNIKDANEPWLDIFCIQCTGSTQEELRTGVSPVGIGLQGVTANNYDGYIYTGSFIFPKFPFADTDSNTYHDPGEAPYPSALKTEIDNKNAGWSFTANITLADSSQIGSELHKKSANNVPLYPTEISTSPVVLIDIDFCANNGTGSNNEPCSSSIKGDIEAINLSLESTPSTSTTGTYYVRRDEICTSLGIAESYCDSTRVPIEVGTGFTPTNLAQGSASYPYTSTNKTDLVNECANMGDYIGCIVNAITLNCKDENGFPIPNCGGSGGQQVTVLATYDSTGEVIPVRIYVTGDSLISGTLSTSKQVVDFGGGQSLINSLGNQPSALRLYGSPPVGDATAGNTSCNNQNQVIGIGGTGDVEGIWAWFPRGLINAGSGTGVVSGALWACDFEGNGNFSFLGANQNIMRNECGLNTPCGLYKYRAQGIAQIERL